MNADTSIQPFLLAKLRALQAIFFAQWRQVPLYRFPTYSSIPEEAPTSHPIQMVDSNLMDLVITDDEGGNGDEGGGGGTMKGLRVEKKITPTIK